MLALYLNMLENEDDQPLFTQLYVRYDRMFFRTALSILRREWDAEDAAMHAWEKIAKDFSRAKEIFVRSCSEFERWSVIIVKNTALDMRRGREHMTELPEGWDVPGPDDTEAEAAQRALIGLIHTAPEQYRAVLELRLISEWSFAEIGRAADLSPDAARMRYNRGLEQLQKKLREEGYEYGTDPV